MLLPKFVWRSRNWIMCMVWDEYFTRDVMSVFLGSLIMMVPYYCYGLHVNREREINESHIAYNMQYGPRRRRLTHSIILEEFEMQVEQWREFSNAKHI